ncbi:MAG TPA: sigma 54-interacting transcriptional regulator [Polyangia bacterium]|nr:sigma 54-interacting transcriptional regulator [Polyangia bacterium]
MAEFDDGVHTLSAHRPTALHLRRAALVVTAGKDAGQRFEFEGRARVGARELADLVLRDAKVSGLHCEITVADGLRVRDLDSKNGTFVGGVRVIEALLAVGDLISVGDTRLRVEPVAGTTAVDLHADDDFYGLVGQSARMRALTARLARLAETDTTVLVQGETGTGKERVAEALHLAGPRAAQPQVTVDCSALPATLIESELFGYERGAFTGAVASAAGAFERAHGGTLFLDEIGELPLELQPKLLRALESRRVRRLGGQKPIAVDVRIVAATNRDLALEVSAGRFREDLYYRLAVVTLAIPPLRERLDDLPLLVAALCRELGFDPAPFLVEESLEALRRHSWPGNVRELRNALERAAVLFESVTPQLRPAPPDAPPPAAIDLSIPLRVGKRHLVDHYERAYVTAMIDHCGGNLSEAARRSGVERISLYRILQRLGLRDR